METTLQTITIRLTGKIPSKKNSKQLFVNKRTGKNFITTSKAYKEWETAAGYMLGTHKFKKYKVDKMVVINYPEDLRRRDHSNIQDSIQDMFVKYKVIEDDNYFMLPDIHIIRGNQVPYAFTEVILTVKSTLL